MALFRPLHLLLAELHQHLSRMELREAHTCLVEFENNWNGVGLSWEPAFLDFLTVNGPPGDLDDGWLLWLKVQQGDFWPALPTSVRLGFRTHYFQNLLGRLSDDEEIRTPQRISKGYLHFLAGRLDSALVLLKEEVLKSISDPLPHLHLGNTQFLLNDSRAARASYRDALLKALKPDRYAEILDTDCRGFLAETDTGEWAVIEACVTGLLPVARLRSAKSVETFLEEQGWLRSPGGCALPPPIQQFYACLVISESRGVAPEEILMKARLHMKFLNGRLHKLHMDRSDAKRVIS